MKFHYDLQPGQHLSHRFRTDHIHPLVSIVTPFYNSAAYWEQTFCCMMNQTFPYFEWIVVDDGSTDAQALKTLRASCAGDSRIRFFSKENEGPAAARNFGAAQASTDLLVFLDADDLIEPTFLEIMYLALQQNPDVSWAYSDVVTFGAKCFLWKKDFSSAEMKRENLLVVTAMIRKDAFNEVGGFDVMGRYYNEDWHFWLKLLSKRRFPVHIGQYLFWYRNLEQGAMAALNGDPELVERNRDKIAEISADVPDDIRAVFYSGQKSSPAFNGIPEFPAAPALPFAQQRRRVLLLLPHMVMGGADQFNLDLIRNLPEDRYEFTIVTTLLEENDWQYRFADLTDDIFVLPHCADKGMWPAFCDYLVRTRSIDIIFNTNSYFSYYMLPWLHLRHPRIPVVDYIHMEEWYYRSGGYARPSGAVAPVLDATYVCNEGTRRVMIDFFGRSPDTVHTVYIGVDHNRYRPDASLSRTVLEQFPQIEGRRTVLFPCRICSQKRPFLMLEIAKRMPELAFLVVGDGSQLEELRDAASNAGLESTVFFAGRQNDMRPWYQVADVTLICSLKEGLSLTAYESLSMATPVITSDVGGQAELVNSQAGEVVPLLQSESADENRRDFSEEEISLYTNALKRIFSDGNNYAKMCQACRRRIESRFSVAYMGKVMDRHFTELLTDEAADARAAKAYAMRSFAPMFENYLELFSDFESLDLAYQCLTQHQQQQIRVLSAKCVEYDNIQRSRSYRIALLYRRIMSRPSMQRFRRIGAAIKRRIFRR